jgi:hypothetical protein
MLFAETFFQYAVFALNTYDIIYNNWEIARESGRVKFTYTNKWGVVTFEELDNTEIIKIRLNLFPIMTFEKHTKIASKHMEYKIVPKKRVVFTHVEEYYTDWVGTKRTHWYRI